MQDIPISCGHCIINKGDRREKMKLWKMHGAGNDFLLTDNREQVLKYKNSLAEILCDRHYGVGADGFIALENSDECYIRMSYFNADGTEDTMCGNGIRCLAKYARDIGAVDKMDFTVETGDGIKFIKVMKENKHESSVMVDMGEYSFKTEDLSIDRDSEEFIEEKIVMEDGTVFHMSCVRIGVNHGVIFVEDDFDYPAVYGREIEELPIFMKDMNVNFVRYIDGSHIEVKTWERGVGKTLACGTGSSAAAVITQRLRKAENRIHVKTPGGRLIITVDGDKVFMEGPAEKVAEVIID